jgi:xylulokinase
MPLVCTMNVTVATEQARKMFGWTIEQLEKNIATAPAGFWRACFPALSERRANSEPPRGTGVFHGLTIENMSPAHMARAVMEGATLGLAYGVNRFRELGIEPTEIRLTGGGSKSPIWRQICADIFGVPTVGLQSAEGAALGAAIQGAYTCLVAHGQQATFRELCGRIVKLDESSRCEPNSDHKSTYTQLLTRQGDLTRRLHAAGYL